ncbi:putative virion structural protein [Salmonella phage SPFM1]|nr:putative virion structural protein [Salmonella phage SPFM1]
MKYETVEINELGFAFLDRVNVPFDPAYIGYDKAFVKLHPHAEYRISTSQLDDIMERYKDLPLNKILWDYLQGILILREDDPTPPPVNPVPLPYLYHLYSPMRDTARDLDTRVEAYLSNWFHSVDDPTIPLRTLVSGDTYD